MSLLTISAILLRSYPYSETSQILRFFSLELGLVGVLARGSRKAEGRRGGPLSSFATGALTLYFRENRELQTFKDFATTNPRRGLAAHPLRLAGASVLGEVVLQHSAEESHPALYGLLDRGLDAVAVCEPKYLVECLLLHLWALVVELGYAPLLEDCVHCGRPIGEEEMGRFDFAAGGLRCTACHTSGGGPRLGPVARAQLLGLVKGSPEGELLRPRAHLRLASDFVTYHISGGMPLRSMDVFSALLGPRHE